MPTKKKVIVTGGCGFLGSHLVDKLILKNYSVYIIDDLSTGSLKNLNKKAKFFFSNIEDEGQISNIFRQVKPQYVFHLAAKINTSIKDENPIIDINNQIVGSINLIKLSLKYKIKKFIFGSSVAVYGKQVSFPVNEKAKKKPDTSYGICKLSIENYLEYFKKFYNLNYISLRYSNIYGKRQKIVGEVGVIAIFLNSLLRKKNLKVFGKGNLTRDYISVEDATELTYRSMKSNFVGCLNVASGKEIKTLYIVKQFKKYFPTLKFNFKNSRLNEIKRFKCDIKLMKKVLGKLNQNFDRSLKNMIN